VKLAITRGTFGPLRDQPVHLVSAGKASKAMAAAACARFGDLVRSCVIAAPKADRIIPIGNCVTLNAGHPLPDDASVEAGTHALAAATSTGGDWLLVLLSGGASAMLALPAAPLTLEDKRRTTAALLRTGTAIDRINIVRKHLSAIKGGRLAVAATRSLTLAISDVHAPVPDDPSAIASGPTVADPSTYDDALAIAASVEGVPDRVLQHLKLGAAGAIEETIKPGDPRLDRALFEVIGGRETAMAAAADTARSLGYFVETVSEPVVGEARDASLWFVARAHAIAHDGLRPLCVIASGETTVRVTGSGTGGRNQEFALAATPVVAGIGRAAIIASAGTDGVDGPTDAAGAFVDSSTLERSQRAGLDWQASLQANDAYHFFEALGDLIKWGPTGTNVGDIQVMLIA
jgi:glycerate 2-kinase